jgi:hypothetical protein
MIIALYVPAVEQGNIMVGRFNMTLENAKEYLLKKAKEIGLTPYRTSIKEHSCLVDFYPWERPNGERPPWEKFRKLAEEFSVSYDTDGDPPWEYTLVVEVPPKEGEYEPV